MALLLFAAPASSPAIPQAPAQVTPSNEYVFKAAFLFHFAQFVEWPPTALKDQDAPLVFCTLGGDPFRGMLDNSVNINNIGNHRLRVLHFKQVQKVHSCQILFIADGEKTHLPDILARLNNSPILTVGESPNFAQDGGMIGFCLEDNRLRFEINLSAVALAKLKISARLLALAKTVIGAPRGT